MAHDYTVPSPNSCYLGKKVDPIISGNQAFWVGFTISIPSPVYVITVISSKVYDIYISLGIQVYKYYLQWALKSVNLTYIALFGCLVYVGRAGLSILLLDLSP